ncbi:CD3337/EF1877 family mobilome membrane protein [Clostridium hydrogeniformans]|uniref:CD3337/EF1877 family mobilome membrane protein n=1 Tax=Clostridium hydrogeniformans TaxID=349933 RepID=UPI000480368D|nr:MFS transporter [Clostridium hydrogeniformans]
MKKCKLILVIVFILTFFSLPKSALSEERSNPKEAMLPSISNLYNYKDNKYFTKFKDNYYLDIKETGMFKAWGGKIFNMLANLIFGLQVILAQIVIAIIYYCFEISFFDIFGSSINSIVSNLQQGIFEELSLLCIGLIGIFYIIKMFRSQRTQVIMAIFQTIFVLVFAFSFFRIPDKMLKGVDDISKGIGHAALEGTFKATNNGKESSSATEAISTNLWLMFVHKPWQIFEFGNTEFAEKNEDKVLNLAPESEDRQKVIDDIAKDDIHFQPSLGLSRLGLSIIYFLIFLIVAIAIILLCLLMIGYQFLMILFAMFAPIVFLMALIPRFGFNTLKNWVEKVIGYGSMKAVMSLVIAVVFSFMLATYQLSDKYGLLIVALVQVTCLGMVWYKRSEILEGYFKFTNAARQPNPERINRQLRRDMSIENGFQNWRKRRNEDDDQSSSKSSNSKSSNKNSSKSNGTNNQTGVNKNKNTNNGDYNTQQETEVMEYNNGHEQASENNTKDINNNLRRLLKVAEGILEQRYEKSMNNSEEKAKRMGTDVEYSSWVKRVMNREKMNLPKFEEREKLAVANQIRDIESKGGNLEELISRDALATNNLTRPTKLRTLSEEKPRNLELPKFKDINETDMSKSLVDGFNLKYGKNYNSGFMDNLIKEYGQQNVKKVLTDMERINGNNTIKNPAGYLTKSLKNNKDNTQESGYVNNPINNASNKDYSLRYSNNEEIYNNQEDNNEVFSEMNGMEIEVGSTENTIKDPDINIERSLKLQKEKSITNKEKKYYDKKELEKNKISNGQTLDFKYEERNEDPDI